MASAVRLCCETSVGPVYQRQTDSSLSRSRNACHPLPRDLVGVPNPLNRVNDLLLHLRGFLNHVVELFCALGETVQPSHVVAGHKTAAFTYKTHARLECEVFVW